MNAAAPAILTIEGLGVRLPDGADRSHAVSGATLAITSSPFNQSGTCVIAGALRLLDGAAPGGAGAYVYDSVTGTLEFQPRTLPTLSAAVGTGRHPTARP